MCFPAVYEKVKAFLANDKIVKINGKIDIDYEKGISCIIDDVVEVDTTGGAVSGGGHSAKEPVATLWLNASAIDDESFDELISVLGNYPGDTDCKIVRGEKRYKLPGGVNYCRGLLAELYSYLEQRDVKYVETK